MTFDPSEEELAKITATPTESVDPIQQARELLRNDPEFKDLDKTRASNPLLKGSIPATQKPRTTVADVLAEQKPAAPRKVRSSISDLEDPSLDESKIYKPNGFKDEADFNSAGKNGTYIGADGQEHPFKGSPYMPAESGNAILDPITKQYSQAGLFSKYGIRYKTPYVEDDKVGDWTERVKSELGNSPFMNLFKSEEEIEEQKFRYLYATPHPETKEPVLKEFVGTQKQYDAAKLDGYNTFGLATKDEGFIKSHIRSFYNAGKETDSFLVGMAGLAYNLNPVAVTDHIINGNASDTWLDRSHARLLEKKKGERFPASEAADEPFTADWFGSGTGSAIASLGQSRLFGGMAGGAGYLSSLAKRGMGGQALAKETINKIGQYGSSAIMNAGAAYNDAVENGLKGNEAVLYATTVGSVASLIETKLVGGSWGAKIAPWLKMDGNTFDSWVANGGQRMIGQELMGELAGRQGANMAELATRETVEGIAQRIMKAVNWKSMASEGLEEGLQSGAEQLGKLGWDATGGSGRQQGQGNFGQENFSFSQMAEEAFFGAVAGGVSSFGQKQGGLNNRIARGETAEVHRGLDMLLADGNIDQDTHELYSNYVKDLDSLYNENKDRFANFEGEHADALKETVFDLVTRRWQTERAQEQTSKSLQDKMDELAGGATLVNPPSEEQKEAALGSIRKRHADLADRRNKLTEDIDKFRSAEEVAKLIAKMNEDKQKAADSLLADQAYEVQGHSGPQETVSELLTRDKSKGATFRHAKEVQLGLNALHPSKQQDYEPERLAEIQERLTNDASINGWFLDPSINNEANRETILSLGVPIEQLPLTRAERKLYDEQLLTGAVDPALAARAGSRETFDNAINAAVVANQQGNDLDGVQDALVSVLRDPANKGVPGMGMSDMHMASEADAVRDYLTPQERELFDQMLTFSGKAISVMRVQANGAKQIKGVYDGSKQTIFLVGDWNAVKSNQHKERSRLFHVLVHETEHGLFDHFIGNAWQDFMGYLRTGKHAGQSQLFKRYLDLAHLSHYMLARNAKNQGFYFVKDVGALGPNTMNPNPQRNTSLTFVREFFAEAMSNKEFQIELHKINFADKKNREMIAQAYAYEPVVPGKRTLLTEIYNLIGNFSKAVRSMLSDDKRTVLREAFDLMQAMDPTPYYQVPPVEIGDTIDDEGAVSITAQGFSAFAPRDLGFGMPADLDELPGKILEDFQFRKHTMDRLSIAFKDDFYKNMGKLINERIKPSYTPGTVRVLEFQDSDVLLITWKDESGNNHRAFISMYGSQRYVNSNVFNQNDLTTLAKGNFLQTFSGDFEDDHNTRMREMLNNLDVAGKENYSGTFFLEWDPTHVFYLNDIPMYGAAIVNYTTQNGDILPVGYMQDLTKVRVGNLLLKGARIEMKVKAADNGPGSTYYVKRDDTGKIISALDPSRSSTVPAGYTLEQNVSPQVNMTYSKVENLTQQEFRLMRDGDTFTVHDTAIEVAVTGAAALDADAYVLGLETAPEARNRVDSQVDPLSFYDPSDIVTQRLEQRYGYVKKRVSNLIRREVHVVGLKDNTGIIHMVNAYLMRDIEDLATEFPGMDIQELKFLGMPEEDYDEWKGNLIFNLMMELDAMDSKHGRKQTQDWSGYGQDPGLSISSKIKYDLESIPIIGKDGNSRTMVDFAESKQMIMEAVVGSRDVADMVDKLFIKSQDPSMTPRDRKILREIYHHFNKSFNRIPHPDDQEGRLPNEHEQAFYDGAKNSYWSQLTSWAKRDAVNLQMRSNGVTLGFADSWLQDKEMVQGMEQGVRNFVQRLRENNPNLSPQALIRMYEDSKAGISNIRILQSAQTRATDTKMGLNELGRPWSQEQYDVAKQSVINYFQLFGIQIPSELFSRTRITKKKLNLKRRALVRAKQAELRQEYQDKLDGIKDSIRGKLKGAEREKYLATFQKQYRIALRAELSAYNTELDLQHNTSAQFDYFTVQDEVDKLELATVATVGTDRNGKPVNIAVGEPKLNSEGNHIKKKESGHHPFLLVAMKLADKINLDIKYNLEHPESDMNNSGFKLLAEMIKKSQGDFQSPDSYQDTAGNKRHAYKTVAYKDELIDRLINPDTRLIDQYNRHAVWQNNIFLKQLQDVSRFRAVRLNGLIGQDNKGVNYEQASNLDFLFMHLAGFVSRNDKADGGTYLHLNDVMSDKPSLDGYFLKRIEPTHYLGELQNIINAQQKLVDQAEKRFNNAFEDTGEDGLYYLKDEDDFKNVSEGPHYELVVVQSGEDAGKPADLDGNALPDGTPVTNRLYRRGWIFQQDIRFYGGQEAGAIKAAMEKEVTDSYEHFIKEGLSIPVNYDSFEKAKNPDIAYEEAKKKLAMHRAGTIKLKASTYQAYLNKETFLRDNMPEAKKEYQEALEKERKRVYREWYFNYTINRFHVSQVLMGDNLYFKPDKGVGAGYSHRSTFTEFSKRWGGAGAPGMKGAFKRPQGKIALVRDMRRPEQKMMVDQVVQDPQTGLWDIAPQGREVTSNRTDAAGEVSESFIRDIQEAYGELSGYQNPFKPVLYGVQSQDMADAMPTYYKLSLNVVPDPSTEAGKDFYTRYPDKLLHAERFYASGADVLIYESGVKVGGRQLNDFHDNGPLATHDFDLDLFRLQNDPSHAVDDESLISGLVQMIKQLGDNGNFHSHGDVVGMDEFARLETSLLQPGMDKLFDETFASKEQLYNFLKEQLLKQSHTKQMAQALDDKIMLDNPVITRMLQNLINSGAHARIKTLDKSGAKLVNAPDIGYTHEVKKAATDYVNGLPRPLRWMGPRRESELSTWQETRLKKEIKEGLVEVDPETKYIYWMTPTDDGLVRGDIRIYPTDILVPRSNKFREGDPIIAARIPGSGKNSAIAGEIVGYLPEAMNNVVVTAGQGPGMLGFDFDVDGLFTWGKDTKEGPEAAMKNQLLDIANKILLDAKNFNESTTEVSTDLGAYAAKFAKKRPFTVSPYSPISQIMRKESNTMGKSMIGTVAYFYGIHSVLSQVGSRTMPNESEEFVFNERAIRINGQKYNNYVNTAVGMRAQEVGRRETTQVFKWFMQLLNLATDNAKEQKLYDMGINSHTATVLMDMIGKGVDIDYALHFINQPIVQEYTNRLARARSASFMGDSEDIYLNLVGEMEAQAQEHLPGYEYHAKSSNGQSRPNAFGTRPIYTSLFNGGKLMNSVIDRNEVSLASLEERFPPEGLELPAKEGRARAAEINQDIVILEKFKYYQSLGSDTLGAGKLIGLASTYPKTYIETLTAYNKINEIGGLADKKPRIDLSALTDGVHAYYNFQYKTLNKLLNKYGDILLYAKGTLARNHAKLAGGKSAKVQQSVMDNYYNYVLASAPRFSTASLTGAEIEPYEFVHASAEIIQEVKHLLPENAFLKFLKFAPAPGSASEVDKREVSPNLITFFQYSDIEGNRLEDIHRAYNELPENYVVGGQAVNIKELVLTHLVYTQGFKMNPHSFAKILPLDVVRSLDEIIGEKSDLIAEAEAVTLDSLEAILEETDIRSLYDWIGTPEMEAALNAAKDQGYEIDGERQGMMQAIDVLDMMEYNPAIMQELIAAGVDADKMEFIFQRLMFRKETLDMSEFNKQMRLHMPTDLAVNVTKLGWEGITQKAQGKGHVDFTRAQANNSSDMLANGAEYHGLARIFRDGGLAQEVHVQADISSMETTNFIQNAIQNGVVSLPVEDKPVLFEVIQDQSSEKKGLVLVRSSFKPVKKIKQFRARYEHQHQMSLDMGGQASQDQVGTEKGASMQPFIMGGVRFAAPFVVDMSQIKEEMEMNFEHSAGFRPMRPELLRANALTTWDAIRYGLRTATSRKQQPNVQVGDIIAFSKKDKETNVPGTDRVIVKVTKAPYHLKAMIDKHGLEKTATAWSQYEGWTAAYMTELHKDVQSSWQFQYEYVATVTASGTVISAAKDYAYSKNPEALATMRGFDMDLTTDDLRSKPYFKKDMNKFTPANKFIGKGSLASSTAAYVKLFGPRANSMDYSETDIVAISAEGNRGGRISIHAGTIGQRVVDLLDRAIAKGVVLITDEPGQRNTPYNIGEQEVEAYLISQGYVESPLKPGVWSPADKDADAMSPEQFKLIKNQC